MECKSINDNLSKYIIKILDVKDIIQEWLDQEKYRIKPLIIYGGPDCKLHFKRLGKNNN